MHSQMFYTNLCEPLALSLTKATYPESANLGAAP